MRIAVILSAYDRMSSVISQATNRSQAKLQNFAKAADKFAQKAFDTGKQLVASGMAVAAPLYQAYNAASDFETKMIDIRKQMQEDTPATVRAMTSEIFKLGKQLPLATGEIQDMVAAGLRMGIAQDKIIEYTKDVTKMSVAFDMGAGEIADSMGKISNVFKIPIDKIGDFADAINYLDDNTMAKGPELIDVLQRIGGSARALNPNQAAALASTMLSLGESAETSGSGISAMLNRLSAAQMQSKKFQGGMMMLGLDAAKLQKQMSSKDTAQLAILDVFERIQQLKPEKQTEALVRLFGAEHGPKLMKLANNVAEYRKQLSLVNGQQKGSMDKEYQKRIQSSAAQMQIFKNKLQEVWVKIGTSFLPSVNKALVSVGRWVEKIGNFISKNPGLVAALAKGAALFSAVALAGGYVSFVVGGVAKALSLAATAGKYLIDAFKFVGQAFKVLNILFSANPWLLAIVAIAAAAFLIIKYWDQIKGFFIKLWDSVKGIFMPILQFAWKFFKIFSPIGWIITFWKPITRFFAAIWETVKEVFFLAIRLIKFAFLNFTPVGLIIKHWKKIVSFFTMLWDFVKGIFSKAINFLRGFISEIVGFIFGIGKKFYDAGANIVHSIINGITSKITAITNVVKGVAKKIRDFFPFSPAKDGPLKDIHKIKLVETIAQTIKPNAMVSAVKRVTGDTYNELNRPGSNSQKANSNGSVNIEININGFGKDAMSIATEVKRQLQQAMKGEANKKARVSFA